MRIFQLQSYFRETLIVISAYNRAVQNLYPRKGETCNSREYVRDVIVLVGAITHSVHRLILRQYCVHHIMRVKRNIKILMLLCNISPSKQWFDQ